MFKIHGNIQKQSHIYLYISNENWKWKSFKSSINNGSKNEMPTYESNKKWAVCMIKTTKHY